MSVVHEANYHDYLKGIDGSLTQFDFELPLWIRELSRVLGFHLRQQQNIDVF